MDAVHVSNESETEDMEVDHLIRRARVDPTRSSLGAEPFPTPPSLGVEPYTAPSSLGAVPVEVIPKTPQTPFVEEPRSPPLVSDAMGNTPLARPRPFTPFGARPSGSVNPSGAGPSGSVNPPRMSNFGRKVPIKSLGDGLISFPLEALRAVVL